MTPKILVVDDEPDVVLLCHVNLEFEGYDVIDAASGEEALLRIRKDRPDLVLLDVMMPGMDGWQVLDEIKGDPDTTQIPVMMLTAKAQERDQIRGWSGGVVDYVTKPFNPIALSQSVRKALEPHPAEEHASRRRRMLDKLNLVQTPTQ
jgi:DNA-binding response OmpR family regulator